MKKKTNRELAREMCIKGMSNALISKKLRLSESTISKYVVGIKKSNTDKVGKGEVKLRRNLRVYETIPAIKKKTIPIKVGDPKNTIIYIRKGDCPQKAIDKYMNR